MSTLVKERKLATMRLIKKLLDNVLHINYGGDMADELAAFEDLATGVIFYRILHYVDPQAFGALDEVEALSGKGEAAAKGANNWVLRRELLTTLMRDMNDYAHQTLGAPDGLDLLSVVDLQALAAGEEGRWEPSPGGDPKEEGERGGPLVQIAGLFSLMVVLSGMPEVLQEIKSLARPQQLTLSRWAKDVLARFHLKPLQRYGGGANANANASASEAPPASSRSRNSLEASASWASGRPLGVGGWEGHPLPAGGLHGRIPSLPASCSAAEAALLGVDDAYYRTMTHQLRGELDDARGRLREAEEQRRLAREEQRGWESKYRLLLAEQTPRGPAGADAADLLRRLALKEEAITALKRTVDEQAAKLSAFKEAAAAQAEGMELVKRRLKTLQGELMRKSNERREAVEKLTIAEDKLALQMQSRQALENELEELRSQVTLLQLANEGKPGGRKDEEDHVNRMLSLSFGSNGSVDRVVQLENELDDVRTQRNTLQRQLLALQRQVATMPSALADPTAANDTLKAHLRQLEREKEELHKQLSEVLERVEIVARGEGEGEGGEGGAPAREAARALAAEADGEHARRERVLLASLLLQYGCRNLLLQQHHLLLHGSRAEAAAALAMRLARGEKARAAGFSGSLLTRQRREVEQGLLETVIHGRRSLPTPTQTPPPSERAYKSDSFGSDLKRWWGGMTQSKTKNHKQVSV